MLQLNALELILTYLKKKIKSIRPIVFQFYIVFMVHVLFEFLRITNEFEIGDWNIGILYIDVNIDSADFMSVISIRIIHLP